MQTDWTDERRTRTLGGASVMAAAVLLIAGTGLAPAAGKRPRPDLRVTSGQATVSGTAVAATVTVRNTGGRRANGSTVALSARRAGTDRVLQRRTVSPLRAGRSATLRLRGTGAALAAGTYSLRVCADARKVVVERSEANNCRTVGSLKVKGTGGPAPTPAPTPAPGPAPTPAPTPGPAPTPTPAPPTGPAAYAPPGTKAPCSTPACRPLAPLTTGDRIAVDDPAGRYFAFVPDDYPTDHSRRVRLLVWLHGCGGESAGDIYSVADYWPETDYIAIAPDGAEGGCWNMATHPARVFTAINDAVSRFNIDPRRISIGGYSSGGDLSYRTALENPRSFAAVLVHNTSPFRDTGRSGDALIADATARGGGYAPYVHHLHNTQDDTYPLPGVQAELDRLRAAPGYADRVVLQTQPGGHYVTDDEAAQTGTSYDIQQKLIRVRLAEDRQAPAT